MTIDIGYLWYLTKLGSVAIFLVVAGITAVCAAYDLVHDKTMTHTNKAIKALSTGVAIVLMAIMTLTAAILTGGFIVLMRHWLHF